MGSLESLSCSSCDFFVLSLARKRHINTCGLRRSYLFVTFSLFSHIPHTHTHTHGGILLRNRCQTRSEIRV